MNLTKFIPLPILLSRYHYKHLYPLYGKPVEFKQYNCVHDNWLYYFPENLKLHNKVCKFEQALATEIERRCHLICVNI